MTMGTGTAVEGLAGALDQLSAMTVAEAFVFAGALLLGFILLASVAVLLSRWLSHSLDQVFEWLLLLALGGLLAWLYFQSGGIPGLGL